MTDTPKKNKVTNKNAIQIAIDIMSNMTEEEKDYFPAIDFEEVLEKLKNIRDSYDKKASSNSQSPNQKENETFKPLILDFLSNGGKYTASEIWRGIPELKNHPTMTNQRVAAILRSMRDTDKTVDKISDKNKTMFFIYGN